MQNSVSVPHPKASATVMVVRPSVEGGYELFMVRRHSKSRFLPDRYVFPGGRLEEGDSAAAALARLHGYNSDDPAPLYRDAPGQGAFEAALTLSRAEEAGLYVAAFRELFEEAGVLLAVEEGTNQLRDLQSDDATAARFGTYREAMGAGTLDFITMLETERLQLDMNAMIYFSHWITPLSEPYRFDARFFLAVAPHDQVAESDHFETTDGLWISPNTVLERYRAGDFNIVFPTVLHTQWLARYPSLQDLTEAARAKSVVTVMPDHTQTPAGEEFHLQPEVADRW